MSATNSIKPLVALGLNRHQTTCIRKSVCFTIGLKFLTIDPDISTFGYLLKSHFTGICWNIETHFRYCVIQKRVELLIFILDNYTTSNTQSMANDMISLFMKAGLTEQRAKETAKNEALSQTLKNVILQVRGKR